MANRERPARAIRNTSIPTNQPHSPAAKLLVQSFPRTSTRPPRQLRTEIAVVGSGPGGAITARTLAEAGRDVVLIEEGPHLPQDSCEPFSRRKSAC